MSAELASNDRIAVAMSLMALLPALVVGGVALIMVLVFNSGSSSPLNTTSAALIQLNARLTAAGTGLLRSQFDQAGYGRVTVDATHFYWESDAGQKWSAPLPAITVLGSTGIWNLSKPHLDLLIEGSGYWQLVVSDRSINRFARNDAKRSREARRAREFADRLVNGGARRG